MSESIRKTYVIEWKGPFSQEDIDAINDKPRSGCLYLISGLVKYEHGGPKLQYIGLSTRGAAIRFKDRGHKENLVIHEKQYWLGHFSNQRQEATPANLELAEFALIYTCQPPLNDKKKINRPGAPVAVINRWMTCNDRYREKRIHPVQKTVPDVIVYDGETIWTCERLKYEAEL